MAINLKKLALSENDLASRLIWVEFKGVKFQIRYVSRATLVALADQYKIAAFDPKRGGRTVSVDAKKFIEALAKTIVNNWENATPRVLTALYPLDLSSLSEADKDSALEFNIENLLEVMENANGLDDYLQECAQEAALFRSPADSSLEKNSKTSQTTT
jgi:hypothetical protein